MLRRIPSAVFGSAAILLFTACAGSAPASTVAPSDAPSQAPTGVAAPSAGTSDDLLADVDVGGRTIHVVCVGPADTDAPTVLLEGGLGSPLDSWHFVLQELQGEHRACAYDRAGLGMSEPAPETSRTGANLVADLEALLAGADIGGPYVIAAQSIGAVPAALFAERHADDVVGLVFVDPRGPRVSTDWAAALPPAAAGEPEAVAANRNELATFETDPSLNPERLHLADTSGEAVAALDADGPLFGDRPVVVLRAGNTTQSWADLPPELAATFDEIWYAGQQELADESTAGSVVEVPGSGHEIQVDQPAAVVDAIESVLAAAAAS